MGTRHPLSKNHVRNVDFVSNWTCTLFKCTKSGYSYKETYMRLRRVPELVSVNGSLVFRRFHNVRSVRGESVLFHTVSLLNNDLYFGKMIDGTRAVTFGR